MVESTARAERYDLQTSTSSFFLWEVPQKPVAVRIPYDLMDRLEREAVDSFRSVTSRGSEIGGLLIGNTAAGSPMVVSIAEYQLIECEYSRGPLYRLSDADLMNFQRAIQQRQAAGSGIAGFFRTHTRKGITLDADDLTVLDTHFRDPHHIGLLVRPFATKASTGSIFIRENGKIAGDTSYLEFPFRSSGGENRPHTEETEAKTAPPPPAASSSAAKPVARGQIVPIAPPRRDAPEEKAPAPPPVAAAPVAPAPAKAAAPAPPKVEEKPKVEARTEKGKNDKPVAKAEPVKPQAPPAKIEKPLEKPVEKAVVKEVEKPVERPTKAAAVTAAPVTAAPKSGKGLKLVLAAAATTALFVVLFVYPGLMLKSSKTPIASGGDTSPLQLRVERTNGELLLTWNRDSDTIKNATKAVLLINDGEQHENVEMDLAQLRNGSIVYSPQTSDISFKMEVTGHDENKTASESVRVLRTRPSPLQDQQAAANAAKPAAPVTPNNPAPNTPAPTAAATPTPAANTPVPAGDTPTQPESKPVVATRAFKTDSLSQRLRPAQNSDLPDAPTVGGGAIASTAIAGIGASPSAPAPIAPAPAAPRLPVASAPAPASGASPKSGGQIQQAVLITKKDPEYPKLARQTGARGIVKLTATVGKDGHVKGVKVVSGHPMLQAAAIDAVKQWVYKPTLLNGQPVETDTEIVLNFVGDK